MFFEHNALRNARLLRQQHKYIRNHQKNKRKPCISLTKAGAHANLRTWYFTCNRRKRLLIFLKTDCRE